MMTTEVKTIRQKIERRTMDELSRDEGLGCLRVGVGKSIHYFAFWLKYFLQENDPSRVEGEPVLCLKMHVDGFQSKNSWKSRSVVDSGTTGKGTLAT